MIGRSTIRILLVEDDSGDAYLVRERLADAPDRVMLEWVDTLDKGMRRVREGGIDAVLLDLGLPESRGLETLHRMQGVAGDVPIVVLTGVGDEAVGTLAIRDGAQDYLVKGVASGPLIVRALRYAIERGRADRALRHTKLITDHVSDGLLLAGVDGKVTYVNPAFERVTGLRQSVIAEMDVVDVARGVVHADGLREVLEALKNALAGRRTEPVVAPVQARDGKEKLVEFRFNNVRDERGIPAQVVLSTTDRTDELLAERAADVSEQLYQSIALHLPGGIVHVIDKDMRYVYSAGQELVASGVEGKDLVGKRLGEVLPLETVQYVVPNYLHALRGENVRFEGIFGEKYYLVNAVPLAEDDGRVERILVLAVNITERKKAEEALQEAHDTLEQKVVERTAELADANRLKSDLVDMVMHDFGDPMWVVKGYAELMRDGAMGALSDEQRQAIAEMLRSVGTLEKLRADMLEISRFEHGRIELDRQECNFAELVRECVTEFDFLAKAKEHSVEVDVPAVSVVCDRKRLRQVICNYLSNAIKYTEPGGKIAMTGRANHDGFELLVADNGPGIEEEHRTKVFAEFYRGGSRSERSTGLGLAVVKCLVQAHGGDVWCDSEPGRGSCFGFRIPPSSEE